MALHDDWAFLGLDLPLYTSAADCSLKLCILCPVMLHNSQSCMSGSQIQPVQLSPYC